MKQKRLHEAVLAEVGDAPAFSVLTLRQRLRSKVESMQDLEALVLRAGQDEIRHNFHIAP